MDQFVEFAYEYKQYDPEASDTSGIIHRSLSEVAPTKVYKPKLFHTKHGVLCKDVIEE